ncbi:MAG: hypothetical protein L3K15_01845 [Thermoplasmata archaeon]|nr:hypothetical protein [Thermoplasmata archaeon]
MLRAREKGDAPPRRPFRPRAARRAARYLSLVGAVVVLAGLFLPSSLGTVLVQYASHVNATAVTPWTLLTGLTTRAGLGVCASTAVGTVPVVAGAARGAVAVTEPGGCGTRTRLAFLPALHFSTVVPVGVGHTFRARLDLVASSGTLALARNVQLYLQRVGAGNPIVSAVHILVRNGVTVTAATSPVTLATGAIYGPGIRMVLNHPAVLSSFTLTVVLYVYLDDGGVVRAVEQQALSFTFSY